MSVKSKLFLTFCVLAFAVAGLRFVPALAISRSITDFATGLGAGLLIGVLITWWVERGAA